MTIEVEVSNVECTDAAMPVPGMRRVAGRAVSYNAPDMRWPIASRVSS